VVSGKESDSAISSEATRSAQSTASPSSLLVDAVGVAFFYPMETFKVHIKTLAVHAFLDRASIPKKGERNQAQVHFYFIFHISKLNQMIRIRTNTKALKNRAIVNSIKVRKT
jgi:hypothetical protein